METTVPFVVFLQVRPVPLVSKETLVREVLLAIQGPLEERVPPVLKVLQDPKALQGGQAQQDRKDQWGPGVTLALLVLMEQQVLHTITGTVYSYEV